MHNKLNEKLTIKRYHKMNASCQIESTIDTIKSSANLEG